MVPVEFDGAFSVERFEQFRFSDGSFGEGLLRISVEFQETFTSLVLASGPEKLLQWFRSVSASLGKTVPAIPAYGSGSVPGPSCNY